MTEPRDIRPGVTWLVTTRCVGRQFLLLGTDYVNRLVEYALAVFAEKFNVALHGAVFMSNHAHLVLTDRNGNLPAMMQAMNSLLARALNECRDRSGSVFERNNVHLKELCDAQSVVDTLVYVAANPVAAACVRYGREWIGVRSTPKDIGRPGRTVVRPPELFLEHLSGQYRGTLPAEAVLRYELPPAVDPDRRGALVHELEVALSQKEESLRRRYDAEGCEFLGPARCRQLTHLHSATSREPRGPGTRPCPVKAADDATLTEAKARRAAFTDHYRQARAAWSAGVHSVTFPFGTWHVVRHHGAQVATGAGPPR